MSDDDLIRRGDALKIAKEFCVGGYEGELEEAFDAIPATDARESLPTNCRKWDFYPIEMPLTKEGQGPAIPGRDEIASITYEVWDRLLNTHASFGNLPDAINEAMRLSRIALENK